MQLVRFSFTLRCTVQFNEWKKRKKGQKSVRKKKPGGKVKPAKHNRTYYKHGEN